MNDTPSQGLVNHGARWLGEAVGSKFGMGKYLGNGASAFARMLGFGRYRIRQNSLLGMGHFEKGVDSGFPTNSAPTFYNGNGASVRLRHKELVTTLSAASNFTLINYLINPGNPSMTSWLRQMAVLYEQYRIHGMIFEYKPNASFVATGGSLGFVNMATDYDCYDTNFANKLVMDTQEYSTDGSMIDHFIHPVECDPNRNFAKELWVSASQVVTGVPGDARLDFLGNFQIAVSGTAATGQIGELWVHYDIEFYRPTAESAAASSTYSQHLSGTTPTGSPYVLGTNKCSTVPMLIEPSGSNSFVQLRPQLQHVPGTYLITCWGIVSANIIPAGFIVLPGGSTAQLINYLSDTSGAHPSAQTAVSNPGGNFSCGQGLIKLVDSNSVFQVYTTASSSATTFWDICLAPWTDQGPLLLSGVDETENQVLCLRKEFESMKAQLLELRNGKDEADPGEDQLVRVEEPETPEPPKAILSCKVPETPARAASRK
jgi:hypothetical protein